MPGTNFAYHSHMPKLLVSEVVASRKAKTVEDALAIIQKVRASSVKSDVLELDFTGITWVTSMFVDRLVKALVTFYGADFEQKVRTSGIEDTNVMFDTLWESAISKVLDMHGPYAEA